MRENALVCEALRQDGYAVVGGGEVGDAPLEDVKVRLGAMLGTFCQPVVVFRRHGLWRTIGVDLDKEPTRSEGVGRSPLHMDFVNTENPPDYVCLHCVRSDPLGGGGTLLAPVDVVDDMDARAKDLLAHPVFSDGSVVDLMNVGGDVNPFAVFNPGRYWRLRYTENLLAGDHHADIRRALTQLARKLDASRTEVRLLPGQAIVFDQRRFVHGKTPLGGPQDDVPVRRRRLLMQAFGRSFDNIECGKA